MRKTALLIVVLVMLLISLFTFPVPAHENVSVYIDGEKIEFDVQPKIINGRTMVPMRKIFEELGATVEWDKATQTATAKKGNTVVKFIVNNYTMYKNEAASSLDVPAQLINDRTLIPLRAVSEAFDCQVGWDGSDCTVSIIDNSENYIMLYALNDRSKSFPADTIDAQLNVGWYTEPVQTLYAPGKSAVFKKSEIVAQLEVGWYTEPVKKIYAKDGDTLIVNESEVEYYTSIGWYDEPIYYVTSTGCFDNVDRLVTLSEIEWCPNGTNVSLEQALIMCSQKSREFQERFTTEEESEKIVLEMFGQEALEEYKRVVYTSKIIDFSQNVYLIAVNGFDAWELYSVNKTTGSCIFCWGGQDWYPGLFDKYKV